MSFIINFKDLAIRPIPNQAGLPKVIFKPCSAIDPTIKTVIGKSFAQAAINYRATSGHPNSVEEFEALIHKPTPEFLELALADSLDTLLAELDMSLDELNSLDINNLPEELIPILDAMELFERDCRVNETKVKFNLPLKDNPNDESIAILILEEAKNIFADLLNSSY